jgi:hypothetical protein
MSPESKGTSSVWRIACCTSTLYGSAVWETSPAVTAVDRHCRVAGAAVTSIQLRLKLPRVMASTGPPGQMYRNAGGKAITTKAAQTA